MTATRGRAEPVDARTLGAEHGAPPPGHARRGVTGRAATGGLLVSLALLGVLSAFTAADPGPAGRYVVAARALRPGVTLAASDLDVVAVDLPDAAAARAFADPTELEGATLLAPLAPGELVQASAVVARAGGGGGRELSFPIEPELALAGTLVAGERVDVLATLGDGGDAHTEIVASGVAVLDVAGGGDTGELSVITVAVRSDEEAVALAHAIRTGELVLVRSTGVGAR